MALQRFNIRVYGVYILDQRLLLSDECRFGKKITKLPGGGLEFGEGIEEGLKREWMEEMATDIQVRKILYVNPFLQVSAFNPQDQVICMYFEVAPVESLSITISTQAFDFPINGEDQQSFRWRRLEKLSEDDFTFPIDKSLVPLLKSL